MKAAVCLAKPGADQSNVSETRLVLSQKKIKGWYHARSTPMDAGTKPAANQGQ